ncbi:MAG: peptidoglycan editing factor PgeF [Pseudomonadota bacterium]
MTYKNILVPEWSLPSNVGAAVTLRAFGNVATHVGDDPALVIRRRRQLARQLELPVVPQFLQQQHTNQVSIWPNIQTPSDAIVADSVVSCAVLTADCLPVLISSYNGDCIAAAHAGWRGLERGILTNTIRQMPVATNQLTAWIGPAICRRCFQVGDEVRQAFAKSFPQGAIEAAFTADGDRWLADLPLLAEFQLRALGVAAVNQSHLCSYCQDQDFFSYRKHQDTGRFASIIWRKNQSST